VLIAKDQIASARWRHEDPFEEVDFSQDKPPRDEDPREDPVAMNETVLNYLQRVRKV
jgi:hypothetical protein